MFRLRSLARATKNERGGAEYITVIIAVSFLLFLFIVGANNAYSLTRRAQMETILRESLFEMERQGGLPEQIERDIYIALDSRGIRGIPNMSTVNVEGTLSPVNYGEQMTLTITYTFPARTAFLDGLLFGGARDDIQTVRVSGTGASRHFPDSQLIHP